MYIHSMDRWASHKSGTGRCYFGHSLEKVCFYFCIYVNIFVSFFSSAPFVLQLPVFFFIFLFNCFSFFSSLFLHYTVLSYLHCSVFALFPYSVLQILHFYFFFFHYLFSSYLCASVPVFSPPSILLVSHCLLCFQTLFFRSPLHFYFLLFPVSSFVLFLFVPFPYLFTSVPVFSPPFTLLVSYSHFYCLTLPSFLSASLLSFTLCLYHVFFSFLAVCCRCI